MMDFATRVHNHNYRLDPIIRSLLDTDFYKFLMHQFIWMLYAQVPVTFGLLLNLVGVMGPNATRDQVWSYLANYIADPDPALHPALDGLVTSALAYCRAFIAPTLHRRIPDAGEAAALAALDEELAATADDATPELLQNIIYEIGKDPHYGFENLRDWFKALYETLLGSPQGPRMGSFIALYGVENTRRLIAEALDGVQLVV